MPDSKITALTSISTSTDPANDPLVIVDVSDTSMAATGTTKKVTLNQLLGASGTATLASATITGDLTVDTSTLKVDSANNRVGIGTATPAVDLHIQAAGSASAEVRLASATRSYNIGSTGSGYGSANNLIIYDLTGAAERYRLDASGNHFWNNVGGVAGTAMTLNSTGLGVGYTPSGSADKLGSAATLGVVATGTTADLNFRNSSLTAIQRIRYTDGTGVLTIGSATGTAYPVELGGNTTTRAITIDASSNVGIGVTPSAWATSTTVWRALDLQYSCGLASSGAGSGEIDLLWNAYYDQTDQRWEFKYTGDRASRYAIGGSGVHAWYNTASTGTANGAITWTQAMTLDASGNLLVGKTAASVTTVGFQTLANGEASVAMAASTGASTTLNVWSTGAAAYRFYVGMNGTISATNTTISAISDARLKENVQDIDVGLGAILALKPRKFDWKAGKGKDIKGDRGFIAQEFEQVFPQLVDEWKDAAPEGEAPYKSVRQDLIPVLVKAIQELAARVQTLETR